MEPGLYEPLTAEEYAAVKIIAEKELERTTYLKREALVWTDAKGHPHREGDLPAIIEPEGDMSWWIHGVLHRSEEVGLPAGVRTDGESCWFLRGFCTGHGDCPPAYAVFSCRKIKSASKK